mmetsp:Transcript_28983/g.50961  ORF Transcript_28983/g.50961 Transcript_28983/m.50961 type:complete len:286 (+) Transcript_28983:603-1460(+)
MSAQRAGDRGAGGRCHNPCRECCELRGDVGAAVRRNGGSFDLQPGRRALLSGDRRYGRRGSQLARHRRSAELHLHTPGGRRAAGRLVREGSRGVERVRNTFRLLVHGDFARLGEDDSLPRSGDVQGPEDPGGRREKLFLRARELHPRPFSDRGRGSGAKGLLRRGGVEFDWNPDWGRHGQAGRPLGEDRAPRYGRHRHEYRQAASVSGQPLVPLAQGCGVAGTCLPVSLSFQTQRDGERRQALPYPRKAQQAGRLFQRCQWLGRRGLVCGRGKHAGNGGPVLWKT